MKTIKLGLVDDHNLFREGIKLLLEPIDHLKLVLEAKHGKDLLNQLRNQALDVLLLDLEMEEMDGLEVTKHLNAAYPEIKIIILSMHREERMIAHLMELGAHGYLLKDASQEELTEAIEKVFSQGFYFNSGISKALLNRLKNKDDTAPQLKNNFGLTERELQVLQLIAQQYTTTEIAEALFLSTRTIEGYRKNILHKMGAKNTVGLIILGVREGLIEI